MARAQYISEVLSYIPAPGQFINSSPWGTPQSAQSVVGGVNGSLSLGAFGGSVIFRFEEAVENDPDNPFGIDFSIFGNPMSQWSEPGVVFVMKDENENGLADDTWYELAGSDHHFSSTRRNYSVNFMNPGEDMERDVSWENQDGEQGWIRANSVHLQPYYPLKDSFPEVAADVATFSGTLIEGAVDVDHPPLLISSRRAFGYADNQMRGSAPHTSPDNPYTTELENSGGDAFDISWAIDDGGFYVELERIHFVKVQSGILHEGGFLGELSTEITGAVDVAPAPGTSGNSVLLVLKDLPPEMDNTPVQLEAFHFSSGRPLEGSTIRWTCSEDWALVDEDNWLRTNGTGPLTISATVDEDPSLWAEVSTLIYAEMSTSGDERKEFINPRIYPNPVGESCRIEGVEGASLSLLDASGRILWQLASYQEGLEIPCGDLKPGIYMLKLGNGSYGSWLRLMKL